MAALLARQPRDRGVVHGHRPGDRPAAFAGLEALESLGLALGELWFAAEADALGLGGNTAVIGALEDAAALVLGHCGQESDETAA